MSSNKKTVMNLKDLFLDFLEVEADFSKLTEELKNPFRCRVLLVQPQFLITDGVYFCGAYFSERAIEQFREKNRDKMITDMREKDILVKKWELVICKVDSQELLTSYLDIELRIVISEFTCDYSAESIIEKQPFI